MKGKTSHDPHTAYYLDQAGSGISKFRGLRVQRGGGLGGFFSSLIRGANHIPALIEGASDDILRTLHDYTQTKISLQPYPKNLKGRARLY